MIGSLLKELMRALRQYAEFHFRRIFGLRMSEERLAGAMPAKAYSDPFPSQIDRKTDTHATVPAMSRADSPPIYVPHGSFDWQTLSDSNGQVYSGGPSPTVLDMLIREPKFILDVGCSRGDFATTVRQRFPHSKIWGIEPNKLAAGMAASRVDRVLCHKIEEIDWNREGVQRGDIDAVFLFDVLEHIYDPWKTLLTLRNLVNETAQFVVSIPNVRNALLIQDLISGYWRYREWGLLDITHIRFFTKQDMYRMFYQTGFRVAVSGGTQCAISTEIFETHRTREFPQTVQLDSVAITVHSLEDLTDLCMVQHQFMLQPVDYDQLPLDERQWIDAPHPPTKAFPAG
jgi:2-polyprenyl-3-methyl-5-hydroxy-6-metoxy-1,4-benzoquinol methylase